MDSGLYQQLTGKGWLIRHTEATTDFDLTPPRAMVILPEQINVISYAYEWSFEMWKDAALLTLAIAKASLDNGMVLKDATPFNVQFVNGRPVFIDTLSFEIYADGKPWIAYRQFCECFLAPLLLQQYCHRDMGKLFLLYPDGVPLDMLTTLLPKAAKWNLHNYLHIYLQAAIKGNKKDIYGQKKETHFSKQKMLLLINGLIGYVTKLRLKTSKSTWDDYYNATILSAGYLQEKTRLVQKFLATIAFESMVDLGANDGYFSLLFKNTGRQIVAVDGDANCINELYKTIRSQKITNILPLISTLQNPSPAIGWANRERDAFSERVKGDIVLALALVHHLAVAGNVPLNFIANWLAPMCKYLLIEFVPKTDEKVQLLLQNREDIFLNYTVTDFEKIFSQKFEVLLREKVAGTERILYLMQRR